MGLELGGRGFEIGLLVWSAEREEVLETQRSVADETELGGWSV